jgi:acyl-coenzyme A synthetase/AMP-(fatty) acid ligase
VVSGAGSVIGCQPRRRPDFDLILRLIGGHRVTTFCAPPTVFRALVLEDLPKYDWSSLRHCVSAGEPLNPEVIKIWRDAHRADHLRRLRVDRDGEPAGPTTAAWRCGPGRWASPAHGFDVCVVDDDGNVLGPREEGHVAVRVNPEATAGAFRGDWYYTGGRAEVDEDGYFWFVGRSDDVIISSAYRIGLLEVEPALVEHPAVAEAAVIGKPDPDRVRS